MTGPNQPRPSITPGRPSRAVRLRRRVGRTMAAIAALGIAFVLFRSCSVNPANEPGLAYTVLISCSVLFIVAILVIGNTSGPVDHPDGDRPTRDTRTVVDVFLARLGDGDASGVAALFAPAVDWALSWPDDPVTRAVPWVRHRPDREAVEQHFRDLSDGNRPATEPTTIDEVLVVGAHAVVLGTLRSTVVATGRGYEARFALHLVVTDGAITGYHLYEDSLAVALAAGAVTTARE